METTKTLQKKIDDLISKKNEALEKKRLKLEAAQRDEESAERAVLESAKHGTEEQYIKAKHDLEEKRAAVEYCKKQVDEAEGGHMITLEEFAAEKEKVFEACDALVDKDSARAKELLSELWDIFDNECQEIGEASATLQKLYFELYGGDLRKFSLRRFTPAEYNNYKVIDIMRQVFTYDNVRDFIDIDKETSHRMQF